MSKVAVLMSTYNGEKYIKEQIESILSQKGDIEISLHVRDDGSTDKTIDILKEYEEQSKLQWYSGENLGPACSFMELLCTCKGYDYYAFADQDDFWLDTKITSAIEMIKSEKCPVLYFGNAKLVDAQLKELSKQVYNKKPSTEFNTLTCAGGLLGCTMVFNQKLAEIIQKCERPQKVVMHDFYIAVLCAGIGGKIIYDENSYIKYRQHGNNVVGVSNGVADKIKDRLKKITKKSKISIEEQAYDILNRYELQLLANEKKWLSKVSEYRKSSLRRLKLAFSLKTHYVNLNSAMVLRLSILLGNR